MKPNCNKCKFKENVAGTHHISCSFIREAAGGDSKAKLLELTIASGGTMLNINGAAVVEQNPHGVRKGWCMWPINFDQIWIDECQIWNLLNIGVKKEKV